MSVSQHGQPLKYGDRFRLFVSHQQEPAHGNCGYVSAYFLNTSLSPSLIIQQSLTSPSGPSHQSAFPYSDLMQALEFQIQDPSDAKSTRSVAFGNSFVLLPYDVATGKLISDTSFDHISSNSFSTQRFTFSLSTELPPPSPSMGPMPTPTTILSTPVASSDTNTIRYGVSNLTLNIVKSTIVDKRESILPTPIRFAKDRSGSPTGGYLTSNPSLVNTHQEPFIIRPITFSIRSQYDPLLSVQVYDTSQNSTRYPSPQPLPQSSHPPQISLPPPLSLSGNFAAPHIQAVAPPTGTVVSTTNVHIFSQHYTIHTGDDISNKTLVFHLNDVGKVTLPMSSLPLPPLNLTYTRHAPPTTHSEFYEYSDDTSSHQTAPESTIRTIQIHGAQLSVNLPIRYTRIESPPKKENFVKDKPNPTFMKPDAPSTPLLISFIAFFFLSYTFILGLQSQLLNSDNYVSIFRYFSPAIIITYILLTYPSLARSRGYSMVFRSETPPCAYIMQFLPPQDNSTNQDLIFAYPTPSHSILGLIDTGSIEPQLIPANSHSSDVKSKLFLLEKNPHYVKQAALAEKYPTINRDSLEFFQILDTIRSATLLVDDNLRDMPYTIPQSQVTALDDKVNKIILPATQEYQEQTYRRAIKQLHDSNGMTSPGLIQQIRQWNKNISYYVNPAHHTGDKVDVKLYYPLIFKSIRESHLISAQDFTDGWTYALDNLPTAATGAGRSGAIFFRSSCSRFIFKTMNKGDMDTLRAVIDDYGAYITTHASLIMRIFGVFRITRGGKKTYFLLANNAFYLPQFISQHFKLSSLYDLKGRVPKKDPNNRLQEANCGVYKDNQLNRVFVLHPTIRDQIISNLDSDVQWLQQHDCIDYSLLVGVAENEQLQLLCDGENENKDLCLLANQIQMPQLPNNLHLHRQIGIQPVVKAQDEGAEVFCVAIVDFLARFKNMMKRGAHAFKSIRWKDDELSTVNSTFYGDRFSAYTKVVFPPNASLLIRSQEHLKEHFLREAQALIVDQSRAGSPSSPKIGTPEEQASKIADISLQPFTHLFESSARSPGALIVTGSKHLVVLPRGINSAPRSIVERSKVAASFVSKLASGTQGAYAPAD